MTIVCNIWMIILKLNRFLYGLCLMLQFSQFVWPLSYSVWDVFNNFLLIDATDRSKTGSDQKRFFIALSLYPLSFFANTPFNKRSRLSSGLRYPQYKSSSSDIRSIYRIHSKKYYSYQDIQTWIYPKTWAYGSEK